MNCRSAFTTVQEPNVLPGADFRTIFNFWRDAKGDAELPPASAISAQKLPRALLGDCSIMSVEDGPKRFYIRLVGTRIVQHIGFDLTNSWGEDQVNAQEVISASELCVRSRLPLYTEISTGWAGNEYKHAKTLMLPYAAADNSVRRILSYVQFSYQLEELVL